MSQKLTAIAKRLVLPGGGSRQIRRINPTQKRSVLQPSTLLANQALNTLWIAHSDEGTLTRQRSATVEALAGMGPKDEIEGMIAAQLLAAHNTAMECYRRAMLANQTFEGKKESLNQANKLSRTYATLLEALNRHRGKGQQTVTVEHVHVHSGGQAVVGVVAPTPSVGRPEESNAKQVAHAPQPALRSADPKREAVPIPRDAERALPDARRTVARCSEGE